MGRYKLTNKAVEDLTHIWNFTLEQWSEEKADIYYRMILENCRKVADHPALGKNYSRITPTLLGIKAGRHIIFFRMTEQLEIEITRILHEQMDLKNRIIEK